MTDDLAAAREHVDAARTAFAAGQPTLTIILRLIDATDALAAELEQIRGSLRRAFDAIGP